MKAKKSAQADLRNKRTLFFEIGMIVAIGIVFLAFQWTSNEKLLATNFSNNLSLNIEDEWLPIHTEMDKPKPEAPKPQVVEVFEIVEDVEHIEDIEIEDSEADMKKAITIIAMEEDEIDESEHEVFFIVEEAPSYPGGNKKLMQDIMSRITYPEIAKENGIEGRVFVQFVVNKMGNVEHVKVARGVDPSLDREAVRAIETLKGWIPGRQRGKAVNVSFTVPIVFNLNK